MPWEGNVQLYREENEEAVFIMETTKPVFKFHRSINLSTDFSGRRRMEVWSAHFYAAWCITKMAKSTVVKLASECLFSVSQNIHVHNRHCLKQIVLKFVISYYSEVYYSILFFMEATSPLRLSSSGYYQRWHCEHISYISITLFINYLLIKCIKC